MRESAPGKHLPVNAWYIGARLEVRQFERGEPLALAPLTVRAGSDGYAFLFRFGSVVLVGLDRVAESRFIRDLGPFVTDAFEKPETESADIVIDPDRGDAVSRDGSIRLEHASIERLQVVAEVLAKSTVLAYFEERVASVFDRVEELAAKLGRGARPGSGRRLLREIGNVLRIQTQTVGRVEVTEKPELTWDDPALDRLYERLAVEYELRDRDLALSRKLELISRTAETYLELLFNRRSLRVEWYIVALIAFEIGLYLWEIFG